MWRLIENDGAVNCQTCIGKSRAAYKKKFLSYHQTDGLSRFKQEANSDLVNRMCFYSMWLDWIHLSLSRIPCKGWWYYFFKKREKYYNSRFLKILQINISSQCLYFKKKKLHDDNLRIAHIATSSLKMQQFQLWLVGTNQTILKLNNEAKCDLAWICLF